MLSAKENKKNQAIKQENITGLKINKNKKQKQKKC